ncbi:MAG: GYD domain-containing protein [Alphaproteobacteria bacterium]
MARYIVTGRYTAEAMRGLLARPSDREAATGALVAAGGGKLLAFYLTTGATDMLMVVETDDMQKMLPALLVAGASGTITGLTTMQAFTSDEFLAAQKRAGEIARAYNSPA